MVGQVGDFRWTRMLYWKTMHNIACWESAKLLSQLVICHFTIAQIYILLFICSPFSYSCLTIRWLFWLPLHVGCISLVCLLPQNCGVWVTCFQLLFGKAIRKNCFLGHDLALCTSSHKVVVLIFFLKKCRPYNNFSNNTFLVAASPLFFR